MEYNALTIEQATEIAEDFEDLLGASFGTGFDSPEITHVVIGPHGEQQLGEFLKDFPANAATDGYQYHDDAGAYDVLVISLNDERGIEACDNIRDYIGARGIRYNFPD